MRHARILKQLPLLGGDRRLITQRKGFEQAHRLGGNRARQSQINRSQGIKTPIFNGRTHAIPRA